MFPAFSILRRWLPTRDRHPHDGTARGYGRSDWRPCFRPQLTILDDRNAPGSWLDLFATAALGSAFLDTPVGLNDFDDPLLPIGANRSEAEVARTLTHWLPTELRGLFPAADIIAVSSGQPTREPFSSESRSSFPGSVADPGYGGNLDGASNRWMLLARPVPQHIEDPSSQSVPVMTTGETTPAGGVVAVADAQAPLFLLRQSAPQAVEPVIADSASNPVPAQHDEPTAGEVDHHPHDPAPWNGTGVWISGSQDASENESSYGWFIIHRGPVDGNLTVNYGAPGGSATATTDYTGPTAAGTVTIPEDELEAWVFVTPVDDATFEGDETVSLTVLSGSGYTVDTDNQTATITIQDNDRPTGPYSIGGVVWVDADEYGFQADGIRTEGIDPTKAYMSVYLWDQDGYVGSTETDIYGHYQFSGLAAGNYTVDFDAKGGHIFTAPNMGGDEAHDSDANQAYGWVVSVAAGGSGSGNVDAGLIEHEVIEQPVEPPPPQKVAIFDADGNLVTDQFDANGSSTAGPNSKGLKVAKMHSAFNAINVRDIGGGQKVALNALVKFPDAKSGHNFIDSDNDRFGIRVYNKREWDKHTGSLEVAISTENASGYTKYNDNPTTVRLVRMRADAFNGWYWSDSMIMVSNATDDEFSNNIVPAMHIGPDESGPGADYFKKVADGEYSFPLTDRTHRIALGGTVKVEYGTLTAMAKVNVAKTVTVSAHILGDANKNPIIGEPYYDLNGNGVRDATEKFYLDIDGSGGYTEQLDAPNAMVRVSRDIRIANECYAQVGVRVVAGTIDVVTAPAAISTGRIQVSSIDLDGSVPGTSLTATEQALLGGGFNTASKTDMEWYYITKFDSVANAGLPGSFGNRGYSFTTASYKNFATPPDLNDSSLIPNCALYYSAAHEMIRIFTGSSDLFNAPNLLGATTLALEEGLPPATGGTQLTDSRRLTAAQEQVIQASKYAQNP